MIYCNFPAISLQASCFMTIKLWKLNFSTSVENETMSNASNLHKNLKVHTYGLLFLYYLHHLSSQGPSLSNDRVTQLS